MTYNTAGSDSAEGNNTAAGGNDMAGGAEMPAPPPWLQFANPGPQPHEPNHDVPPQSVPEPTAQVNPEPGTQFPNQSAPGAPATGAEMPAYPPHQPHPVQPQAYVEHQQYAPGQMTGQPYQADPGYPGYQSAPPPGYGAPADPMVQQAQWSAPPAEPQNQYPPAAPPAAGPPPGAPPMGAPYAGYPSGPTGFNDPHGGPALDEVALIRKARRAPGKGWRRAVHTLSGGAINPGESQSDINYQQLLERVNRPVRGDYRIAVLSLKGGVGKTTTSVGLGSTFASLRGDRVIAVDANPDLGTLAQRIPQQTRSTVRDLLADRNVYRYSDVRAHTSQAPSRLEILASERDPAVAEAFSEEEYRGVIQILQRFYNIIITDCGTGLSHSAMNGVLDLANAIILVSSPALDGARSAGATLDWLEAHGYGHLVSRAVVVLSSSRPGASTIDTAQLGQHFLTRCRAVHQVPFDDHLSEGAEVDLDLVSKQTRRAFVELAATIADDFATPVDHPDPFYH